MFTLLNLIIAVLGILVVINGITPLLKSETPVLEKIQKNKELIKSATIFFITLQLLVGMFQMRKLMSIGMDDFEMLFYLLSMLSVLAMTVITGKEVTSALNNSKNN
jgi:hypothetical protein